MTSNEIKLALASARAIKRLSLRRAAKQIGIGFNTVLRIENGGAFDYETGQKVINWLHPNSGSGATDTPAAISAAIFADTRLSDKQKRWMASAFAEAYALLVEKNEGKK